MGKQKLTPRLVRNIILMLREGSLTHREIAERINASFSANRTKGKPAKTISREMVTKINAGLRDINPTTARWVDVVTEYKEEESEKLKEIFKLSDDVTPTVYE